MWARYDYPSLMEGEIHGILLLLLVLSYSFFYIYINFVFVFRSELLSNLSLNSPTTPAPFPISFMNVDDNNSALIDIIITEGSPTVTVPSSSSDENHAGCSPLTQAASVAMPPGKRTGRCSSAATARTLPAAAVRRTTRTPVGAIPAIASNTTAGRGVSARGRQKKRSRSRGRGRNEVPFKPIFKVFNKWE